MKLFCAESNSWRQCRSWAVLATVCLLSWQARGIGAAEVTVEFGIESFAKVGRWTPLQVRCDDTSAAACEVETLDPDGVRVVYPLVPKPAAEAGSAGTAWSGVIRCGRMDSDIVVRVLDAQGQMLTQKRLPTRVGTPDGVALSMQSTELWIEVGLGAELLVEAPQLKVVRWDKWPSMTEIPHALESVDGVVLTSRHEFNDQVAAELARWLRSGGQVLLQTTDDPDAFAQTRWGGWLRDSIHIQQRARITDLGGIESFTGFGRKIPAAKQTPVTLLSVDQGRTLASCQSGSLVARSCLGFGLVTVVGFDMMSPPISRWDGRDALIRRLLFRSTDTNAKSTEAGRLSQSGITDLASQWRAATIEIPDVARPTMWGVLGLLLTYALLIGPLDYVLVHKLLRRPVWTWATLPVFVAIASVATLWLARSVNGNFSRLTQLDVFDLDVSRQEVTSRSWATTYSSGHQLLSVAATPQSFGSQATAPQSATISWLGFPENGPGGMYRPSGVELGRVAYRSAANHTRLDDVPLAQWATKTLTAEGTWSLPTPLVESSLTSPSSGELSGTMVHHFPHAITDWIVVFDGRVFYPHPKAGEAATRWLPGQPWVPKGRDVYARELRGFLTRTKTTKRQSRRGITSEDILVEQERYNPLDLDPADILQMMTLHESAGGKAYTGLDHASLRSFDVTPLLTLDRAVLIGRVSEPLTEWKFNGESRKPTRFHGFVRLLLPVKRQATAEGFRVLPKFESKDITIPEKTTDKPRDAKTESANEKKSP